MAKKKSNKQLPGQISLFDGQKMEELYNQAKALSTAMIDEVLKVQELLEKMSLEEWNADENRPQRDLKDCLIIAGIHMTDVLKQLEKASEIEFQKRISKSLG
jgi:DNA-binding MarR family transcriptional regulator